MSKCDQNVGLDFVQTRTCTHSQPRPGRRRSGRRAFVWLFLLATPLAALAGSSPPGQLVSWGAVALPYVPPGKIFTNIAAGGNHSLGILNDGTVLGWGCNDSQQVFIPGGLSNVIAVAAGWDYTVDTSAHSLALKSDGTVVGWGDNSQTQTSTPAGLGDAVLVLAGGSGNFSNSRYRSYSLAIPVELRLAGLRLTNNVPALTFRTFSGQHYVVQHSPDLSSNSWSDLPGGAISGNGSDAVVSDSAGAANPSRFYRIKQQQ